MSEIKLSVIVPVYNRDEELSALLDSLKRQAIHEGYEVIVVDDGSETSPEYLTEKYKAEVPLTFIRQKNQGPGPARNTGAQIAGGQWFLFLDSDCELPDGYLNTAFRIINDSEEKGVSLVGGPDIDREDFTLLQKAINYAMTSPLTTGGIRGSKKALDKYYPRSFNMLVSQQAFNDAGGFAPLRFGEDLDLSMRILSGGGKSLFEPGLEVVHRRRTSLKAFFKQVFNSGMARIVLNRRHPGTLRAVHLVPSFFVLFVIFLPLIIIWMPWVLYFCMTAAFGLILHAFICTNSLLVSFLSLATSFVQLSGYGLGLMFGWYRFTLRGHKTEYAFTESFYD